MPSMSNASSFTCALRFSSSRMRSRTYSLTLLKRPEPTWRSTYSLSCSGREMFIVCIQAPSATCLTISWMADNGKYCHRFWTRRPRMEYVTLRLAGEFPKNLTEHTEDDGDVAGGDFQAADEAAHLFVGGCGGDGVDVAALAQRFEETQSDLLGLAGGGGADLAGAGGGCLGVAGHLVEAERDR